MPRVLKPLQYLGLSVSVLTAHSAKRQTSIPPESPHRGARYIEERFEFWLRKELIQVEIAFHNETL
jgi:hypothetical protein